ncbi:MAG: glycosyltransferase family 1 protein [bacterium]|nr:glycosyltransferase family 1 protein [bacterium]
MKIAVNLFLASPGSITGAFVYIEDILPALFKAGPEHTYYFLGHAETIEYFRSKYGSIPNVKYRVFDIRRDIFVNPLRALMKVIARVKKDNALRERIVAREVRALIKRENIDLYFSPTQTIYPRGFGDVKAVTTILDLQFEYFPQNFPASYLSERRADGAYAVERSDRLIAISKYTQKSLEEKYHADPAKMRVIYFAPHEIENTPTDIMLPQDFIFYPAALWPHKNHAVLIKALGLLKDTFPALHAVCAGVVKRKDLKKELEEFAEAEGVKDRVLFPGYVESGNLRLLYTKTRALVFPSAFEGFGIPLVEAFQFGVPVIAADNTSITEIVDGAGILVPTGDAQALAQAIERVLTDTTLRDELIHKGHERVKLFSWDTAAAETLAVFKD